MTLDTLNSSMLVAAELGYVREVNRLLDEGADVNARTASGSSALNEACVQGSTPIVGLLLRRDADPNIADQDLRTPLHRCAFHGWDQCIRLLLDYGADPQKKDDRSKTPVDVACDSTAKQMMIDYPRDQTNRLLKMWDEKYAAAREEREEKEKSARQAEQERQTKAEEEVNKENVSSHAEEVNGVAAEEVKPRGTAMSGILQNAGTDGEESRVIASILETGKEAQQDDHAGKKHCEDNHADNVEVVPPLVSTSGFPDVYVTGAADKHLNGRYVEVARNEHRVELVQEGNQHCQIFWASYTREWRMLCANFKGGNTLFRNPATLGLNAVPLTGWIKWFGKGDIPTFSNDAPGVHEEISTTTHAELVTSETLTRQEKEYVQFLEPTSILSIVPEPDVACDVPTGGGVIEVEQDWTLIDAENVDLTMEAVLQAKADGVEWYSKKDLPKSIDRFTRAIKASEALEPSDEVTRLRGILHSNRSLAFMNSDPPVYSMVIADCNEALRADPRNFKALYRRAIAMSVLGDYENAFADITKVLDHYARTNAGQNPLAVKLREEIKENLRLEQRKWKTTRQRTWNRAIPKPVEGHDSVPRVVTKMAKTKWTAADVEKHLLSGKTGEDFWGDFCSIEIFKKTFANVGLSVDAFSHLLKVVSDADDKKAYLDVAMKTLSPPILYMLSPDERTLLNAL